MIRTQDITAVILAGGLGTRMGGVDKGLQALAGRPLVEHVLERLRPQAGAVMINANRNLPAYQSYGLPVWPDILPNQPGPLAGFLVGLERCVSPWLLTAPCDTPRLPPDLGARLAAALEGAANADLAMATARDADGAWRPQPVFCLLRTGLRESLQDFLREGGRKVRDWTDRHRTVLVPFDATCDDPRAFFNANTLAELHQFEQP